MTMWWVAAGGSVYGPSDAEAAKVIVRENPGGWAYRTGWPDWQPAHEVPDIRRMKKDGVTPFPPPPDMMPKPAALPDGAGPPPVPAAAPSAGASGLPRVDATKGAAPPPAVASRTDAATSGGFGAAGVTEGIDFRIHGHETQFLEIELDPGESAIAEAGAMMAMSDGIVMTTIFGDGTNQDRGFMGKLLGAGKRILTGESLFATVFTHEGRGKARVYFGAPFPGTVIPVHLATIGGRMICQKDSFLAAAKGVEIGLHFQRKILTGLFGGEGFIMQRLTGDGWAFLHVGGTILEHTLAPGETLRVDTGCVAAYEPSVEMDIVMQKGVTSMIFGGEGLFLATLTGPGKVWLQSLPFSRFAGRVLAAGAPTSRGRGEGSILGGLGGLLDGDNRF